MSDKITLFFTKAKQFESVTILDSEIPIFLLFINFKHPELLCHMNKNDICSTIKQMSFYMMRYQYTEIPKWANRLLN